MTDTFQVGDFVLPCSLRAYHCLCDELDHIEQELNIPNQEHFPIPESKALRPYKILYIHGRLLLVPGRLLVSDYVKLYRRSEYKAGDQIVLVKIPETEKEPFLKIGARATVGEVTWDGVYLEFDDDPEKDTRRIGLSEDCVERHKPDTPVVVAPLEPKEKPPMEPYRLSFISLKKGRNRPATNMFQMVCSQLATALDKPDWKLNADGDFGPGTDKIARAVQKHYALTVDGWIGKNSWLAMTADLPDEWRAPLRYRIAECQCTFESGKRGYGYYGVIPYEGWYNYGIWNCNRYSAKRMLQLGGASHLRDEVDKADSMWKDGADNSEADKVAYEVAYWYGSKVGRETQTGIYFLKETILPSIKNLLGVGFPIEAFGISSLDDLDSVQKIPDRLDPFYERLLTLSCDITVNSGASGFQPKKSPRAWDGTGTMEWPTDRLPDKEAVKKIFEEVFGGTISSDNDFVRSDSRDSYRQALKRNLWEVCKTDEQRIELIAELQGRCIIEKWRTIILQRRRCVARKEGGRFQSAHYCMSEHFGIGV